MWARRLHRAFGILNVGFCGVFSAFGFAKLSDPETSFIAITTSLCVSLAAINIFIRGIWIFRKYKEVESMEQRLMNPLATMPGEYTSPAMITARQDVDWRIRTLMRTMLTFCFGMSMAWDVLPYLVNRLITGELSFQRVTVHFLDVTRFPGYELECFIHTMSGIAMMSVCISIDCFAYCVFMFISFEFKILNLELRTLGGNKEAMDYKSDNTDSSEEEITMRLKYCIQRHSDIIKFAKEVENVFSPILLLHFLVCAALICLNGFQITLAHKDPKSFLKLVAYISILLLDVFIFCYLGEEIRQESVRVSQKCYASPWYKFGAKFRRDVAFMIIHAQRPVALTAGRMYVISLDTFVQLISSSYSMLALLLNINEDQS